MRSNLPHILSAMFTAPWAIEPAKGAVIADVLLHRAMHGHALGTCEHCDEGGSYDSSDAKSEREKKEAAAASVARIGGGVALVPVFGSLVHRGSADNSSGVTSTETVARKLRAADADPSVGTIVLDIDSPGGEVAGTPELAAVLRGLTKPTVAQVNSWAASAAYWLASQADEVVVTPSGEVGSIGVLIVHQEVSQALAARGVRVTVVNVPAAKAETNPWRPLTPDALADLQRKAAAAYEQFVADVAAGRGVSAAVVRGGFGQGRMVLAADAVRVGMADRVATLEDTIGRYLAGAKPPRRRGEAVSVEPRVSGSSVHDGRRRRELERLRD